MSGISDSLVYNPKPRAAMASKVRVSQPPLNGSEFHPGDTIQIAVPCGTKGQFLNTRQSYLKFKVKSGGTSADTLAPDYSASAFFRQLEVTYGSSVLEYVTEYNVLYHTLLDASGSPTSLSHSAAILEGTASGRVGEDIAGGTTRTFCIPLVSGVLGTLQGKYLPIGDMVRNHLKLQLTLANQNDAYVNAAARTWSIEDVEFVMEVVQLNVEAANAISSMNSGGYRIAMHTFSCHSSSVEQGAKNAHILISGNYRSLKTLFSVFRKQSNSGDRSKKSITDRYNPFSDAGRWYYDVGGYHMPQRPVDSDAEAFAELMKSLHAFGSAENVGLINNSTWTATEGSYIVAQDLESQSHKSSLSEAGVDVSSANVHLVCEFSTTLPDALRVDTFSHQDAVLYIDPTGQAQTLF